MLLQIVQIIEPDIGSDLEFQYGIAFLQIPDQLMTLRTVQGSGVKPVPDAHLRHRLTLCQRLFHTADAVGHIVLHAVVFPGMDADHKRMICRRDLYQFTDHRPQFEDAVDLFPDNVRPGHIRILGQSPQHPDVFFQIVGSGDIVPDDGQRNSADRRQEAQQYAGFLLDLWHDRMDLPEHFHGLMPLHQGGIADLGIVDALAPVAPGCPQQLVLEQRIARIDTGMICLHLPDRRRDIFVGYLINIQQFNRMLVGHTLGEDIAVQVDLFQIGKDSLAVLQNRQGSPDQRDVVCRVIYILQDQGREINAGIVIDLTVQILAGQLTVRKLPGNPLPQPAHFLFLRHTQP